MILKIKKRLMIKRFSFKNKTITCEVILLSKLTIYGKFSFKSPLQSKVEASAKLSIVVFDFFGNFLATKLRRLDDRRFLCVFGNNDISSSESSSLLATISKLKRLVLLTSRPLLVDGGKLEFLFTSCLMKFAGLDDSPFFGYLSLRDFRLSGTVFFQQLLRFTFLKEIRRKCG